MIAFLIKRLMHAFVVMFVISVISFAIQSNLGDPIQQMVGQSVPESQRAELREELGLNDSFLVQYGRFATNALQGDFGYSYFFNEPTTEVIQRHLPATLELVIAATLIIVVFSVPIGVYCAIRPRSALSRFFMSVSIIGISIPVFLTAIMLIQLFAIGVDFSPFPANTGWGQWLNGLLSTEGGMPSYGRGNDLTHLFGTWDSNFFSLDGLTYLVLPAISLASIMLPLFIRLIRAEMLEVLQSEYVKFATAKGISLKRIYFVHALKNTMLPVITVGGVQLGTMVAYTILTETVFQWPGMGLMFLEAIQRSDIPLIVTYLMIVGLIFVVTNTLVDLIYGLVNPTVKLTGKPA
ncbi:peptide/nickel transport system permease protein [Chromohalobacter canadensis]|uniref:Peptide/nickel transport system permease protein n=1 Tax=Chromohalobacter canadensis TaxID=141389 RepID=A0A285VWV4_9GAMM|nr:ABC transporter permease [Chromohalobacter canadensis]SOC57131.1 peptide/nickel transport system permease protein [Chromohalobacter canadensis]